MKSISEYINEQINVMESKYINLEQIFKGRVNFGDFRKRNELPFYILIDSKNSIDAIEINDVNDINKLMDSIVKNSKSINMVVAFDKTEKNAVEGRLIDLEEYINK